VGEVGETPNVVGRITPFLAKDPSWAVPI
jgi:hypothetical protein